ncbi:MAG: ABC transporter ATP-binding protein [bacterium]|nr:ABC transporter ATP-binding protein [bacterium]
MMLEIKKLSKSFGGVEAVRDCSFGVPEGKITALIGPNGAGKTTVFNLVSGILSADRGQVIFQHNDITNLPAWRRSRAGLSRTFQLARLFKNLTVEENLMLAARYDDDGFLRMFFRPPDDSALRAGVREMMKFVGLDKAPETPATELSYGQQKLFDLCRALLNPHTFLMLDEPVAGINLVLREKFKDLVKDLQKRGETVLLIEHDMDFVRAVADYVIVLDQGEVLAEGEPAKVLKDKKVLEAYLGPTG